MNHPQTSLAYTYIQRSPITWLGIVAFFVVAMISRPAAAAEPSTLTAQATEKKEAAAEAPKSDAAKPDAKKDQESDKKKDPYAWQSMFDGKTLKGWKAPRFGGEGEVRVENGMIVLPMGYEITGVTWTGELPKVNYEFRMEARRTQGNDFFATTTFPYGEDPCTLVVGGWGGGVVGLSNVDGYDASENVTTQYMGFKDNQWYRIRVRVSKQRIEAWIDDEKMVDLATKGHKFSIRFEVDLCKPFGICTWCSEGQIRKMEIRSLKPEEVAEIPARDRWD